MADVRDQFSIAAVDHLAASFEVAAARLGVGFDGAILRHGIGAALEPLSMSGRSEEITNRLVAALPPDPADAGAILGAALDDPTLHGWITMPVTSAVARILADRPDLALPLLAAYTPRFSAEFAIRPFIEAHPEYTLACLAGWVTHPDEHVRRLVSEGTRPRLPWAPLLRRFVLDPAPVVPLLEALSADPSASVRRSVANHLNDISKDHPDLALRLAAAWWGAAPTGPAVVRHGLRTLIKRGDPRALALIGVDIAAEVTLDSLTLATEVVPIGGGVEATFVLRVPGPSSVDAVIDYRIHYQGARGLKAPRVFKLTRRRLPAGEPVTITRRHPIDHVSIRRILPGEHRLDVQVNGVVLGGVEFTVR